MQTQKLMTAEKNVYKTITVGGEVAVIKGIILWSSARRQREQEYTFFKTVVVSYDLAYECE